MLLAVLLLAAWAPVTGVAAPLRVRLTGSPTGCPRPAAVGRELTGLQPGLRIEVVEGPAGEAVIWDQGARYGVQVGATRRELRDDARRCADRARALAVVIALALFPPEVALPVRPPPSAPPRAATPVPPAARPPPRSSPPPPAARASSSPETAVAAGARPASSRAAVEAPPGPRLDRRAAPPSGRWRLGLELGGTFDGAPGAEGRSESLSGGFSARFLAGGRHLQLVAGVGIQSPTTTDASPALARVLRIPLDLGVRGLWWLGRARLTGDLGLAATVARFEGQGLAEGNLDTRLELGLRAAFSVGFRVGRRWVPFAAIQMTYVPSPFTLAVEPLGQVGSTPRLRLGGLLGIAVRLR